MHPQFLTGAGPDSSGCGRSRRTLFHPASPLLSSIPLSVLHLSSCRFLTCYKAVYAILIADMLFCQSGYAKMIFLPFDNRIIVLFRRPEIAESRMLNPFCNWLRNWRAGRKIHICHPHRNKVKTIFRFFRFAPPIYVPLRCLLRGRLCLCGP